MRQFEMPPGEKVYEFPICIFCYFEKYIYICSPDLKDKAGI
jgi:hypothetical protein